eukprot:Clim_evm17s152 gene=Clim_evmTU17s152
MVKKTLPFRVKLYLHGVYNIPLVNGVLFARVKSEDSAFKKVYTDRSAIEEHAVQWTKGFEFDIPFKTHDMQTVEPQWVRIDVRTERQGGKKEQAFGSASIDLAALMTREPDSLDTYTLFNRAPEDFEPIKISKRYLLETDKKSGKANAILRMTVIFERVSDGSGKSKKSAATTLDVDPDLVSVITDRSDLASVHGPGTSQHRNSISSRQTTMPEGGRFRDPHSVVLTGADMAYYDYVFSNGLQDTTLWTLPSDRFNILVEESRTDPCEDAEIIIDRLRKQQRHGLILRNAPNRQHIKNQPSM